MALGTGAVMSALRRLAIGPFRAEDGVTLDQLSPGVIEDRLIAAALAITPMEQIVIDADEAQRA